jgi:hypothetical protein
VRRRRIQLGGMQNTGDQRAEQPAEAMNA